MAELVLASHQPPRPEPSRASETLGPRVLWLLVSFGKGSFSFEFPRRGQEVVTVGGAVDCRVWVEGLPPVAFHIERDGRGLVLVRGYSSSLRLNARQVTDSAYFFDQAVVELGEYRFVLYVLETRPAQATRPLVTRGRPSRTSHFAASDLDTSVAPLLWAGGATPTPTQDETVSATGEGRFESTQVLGSMPDVDLWGSHCVASLESSSCARLASDIVAPLSRAPFLPSDTRRPCGVLQRGTLAVHRLGLLMQRRPILTVGASAIAAMLVPLVLLVFQTCNESEHESYHLVFESRDNDGKPLSQVAFSTEGRSLGTTGTSGGVHVVLHAPAGGIVPVDVDCPAGYVDPARMNVVLAARGGSSYPNQIAAVAICEVP